MPFVHPPSSLSIIALSLAFALAGCAGADKPASRQAGANLEKREQSFDEFLDVFRKEALAGGIRKETLNSAFVGMVANDRVMALMNSQPEFVRPIWDYLERAVSERRIAGGRRSFAENKRLLARTETRYGVPAQILVAIWGIESNYGSNTGSFNIIQVLATQAWKGRRAAWARGELMHALRILDKGEITAKAFKGSWAGAFGQTQFMPSVYRSHAVDNDGDGRRDLWRSLPDVFASTSNLLRSYGWRPNEPWGFEVKLPKDFPWAQAEYKVRKSLADWQSLGVRRIDGGGLAGSRLNPDTGGSIILPAGHKGPAFVVLHNFRALLRYNNATSYALAVAHLSDRVAGGDAFTASWPTGQIPLTRGENKELQQRLTAIGCDSGKPDGVVGKRTRAAVRCYQRQVREPADGYPTAKLLARLRGGAS
ncbi:MAG: lytic murein transglycosylase [Alphaproteobacteria bacterium]|nr:lytic murein transglycosylase [Alphaproteobacteria bacterium]